MLELLYNSADEIPEGYADLYTEKDGKWHLTGVKGMKTETDTNKLSKSLREEREAHKKTKDKLAKLGGDDVDIDEVVEQLDELEDLRARIEAGEGGKVDEAKLEELVEARLKRQLKPLERERDQLKSRNQELEGENGQLKTTINNGTIESRLRELATSENVVGSAMDDIVFMGTHMFEVAEDGAIVAKEGARGVEAGITPDIWLADMKEKRPHWWPASQGGGAGGGAGGAGSGSNPWGAKSWDLDAQGAMVRQDRAKAERMAKAAGSKIGAIAPASSE
ncbi:hypothetical protein [Roseobacter phage RDJL3]|nr:hypothetical protein [Roseobacter phage RDJL3]